MLVQSGIFCWKVVIMFQSRVFLLLVVTAGALVGCGSGGYSYSPPPPPAPGSGAEAQADPNAGVSIDPALMNQGMETK
jgi:hypothetical protein